MVRSKYMRSRSLATVAALALLAGGGTLARAQQAPANQASANDEPVLLDAVTVTATKTSEKLIDTLGGVSQVTRAEIDRAQPASVSDLLKAVPGVATQTNSNDPMQAISIRGLQDFGRVNVLVDGARQDYQISGHGANGSFYLEPEFIDNIDIVRGPVANLYGSGAIGGVASFTTRGIDSILTPDENWGVEQKVGVSTNGLGAFTSTSAAKRFGSVADIYGQFIYRDAGSYRDGSGDRARDSGKDNFGGLLKFNYRPGEGQTISLSALSQKFDFTNNGTSNAGSRFRNDVKTSTVTAGYKFESPDNPWINFNAKVYYSHTENEQTMLVPTRTYVLLGATPGSKRSDRIDTFGFDIYNTSRFSTGVLDHALTYGADAAFDKVETRDRAGGYISAFTPSGKRQLLGAYVQDEIRYDDWLRVLGGLRYDHYKLEGGKYESDGSHLSPKITIGVTPIKGIELYGTYAEGYRSPSISETLMEGIHPFPAFRILPNPNLRPEVGHTFEVGVNAKYDNVFRDGDTFRAKLNGFVNNVDDYIDTVAGPTYLVPPPGTPPNFCQMVPQACIPVQDQQYQNIAKARLMGIELEGTYDWGGGFVSIAASHVNGKNKSTHLPLNNVAPNKVSGTVGLRFWEDRLIVGSRLTLVGATSQKVRTPSSGYGLVDVFASYKYSDDVSASLAVDNILDRRYKAFLNSDYSPGIAAKFALTVKLAGK